MCLGKFVATVWKNASTWKLLPRWSYSVDTNCLLSPAKDRGTGRRTKKTKCLIAQPHGCSATHIHPCLHSHPASKIPHVNTKLACEPSPPHPSPFYHSLILTFTCLLLPISSPCPWMGLGVCLHDRLGPSRNHNCIISWMRVRTEDPRPWREFYLLS